MGGMGIFPYFCLQPIPKIVLGKLSLPYQFIAVYG